MTTPFERHRELHGETSKTPHPNGFHIIEECPDCGLCFQLPCAIDAPGTVPHTFYFYPFNAGQDRNT